jgi:anaphase-promoting complex subunit 3
MSTALTIVVDKHSESRRQHLPDAAAVNYLLGKLWVSYGGSAEAIDYFVEALRLNPFLWDAFSDLCSTGKFCKRSSHCYAHK